MKYKKFSEHTPENYLKAILESIIHYNSHARADISNWLYEGYKRAKEMPEKRTSQKTIILELLSKWIEIFEDVAVLGLMFAGDVVSETRPPHEIYVKYHTQQITKFFYMVKKRLPKKAISQIYAIKTTEDLLKEKAINKREYKYFKQEIDKAIEIGQKTLFNIAREFVERKRRKKNVIDYGFLVNVYFQTKHGFKVIQPTTTSKKIWAIEEEDIAIIERIYKLKWGRNILRAGIFRKFTDIEVELLVKRINDWSEVTREIALAQLEYLKNPNWIVPKIRLKKTKELIKIRQQTPERNEQCFCDSEKKFKKCCYLFLDR